MNARALLLTSLLLTLIATAAVAEPRGDRVRVTPTVGHLTFDATEPWNSIDATVLYGGSVGVKVNRWFGVNSSIGFAYANGNFGWVEDGMGGFVNTDLNGTDVDVLHFGFDFSFHPMEGDLDPWVMVGWTIMQYDFEFDTTAFGNFLSDNGAQYELGDLKTGTGWQFGIGGAWAFYTTDHSSWSIMADFRDLMVSSKNLEIINATGETVLESSYGHNLLFNLGIEMSWGGYEVQDAE